MDLLKNNHPIKILIQFPIPGKCYVSIVYHTFTYRQNIHCLKSGRLPFYSSVKSIYFFLYNFLILLINLALLKEKEKLLNFEQKKKIKYWGLGGREGGRTQGFGKRGSRNLNS